ncbi:uncharacterized protein LOC119561829 [Drosophila subpulchrella]|uniref:uncharacterized protein LOC119561829 n=1 Tax=Drosophila subpulchrella TaxID=1486046 RepID=UPI0018A18FC9|nr:uncharacterized protein LOC119561829 [Drosophila subpulchrella]
MSNDKEVCSAGNEPKWSSEGGILKGPKNKMITSQECMQLKRDLESAYSQDEFEVSPMILCLMLTFMLFVIGFWIWLISRSCLFAQPEEVKKKDETQQRLSGGSTPSSKSPIVRFLDGPTHNKASSTSGLQKASSNISSRINRTPRFWKNSPMGVCRDISYGDGSQGILKANYCTLMQLPETSPVLVHTAAETESGAITETISVSSIQRATKSSPTYSGPRASKLRNDRGLDMPSSQAVAGSPLNYDSMPPNFGRESSSPKRKYTIKWANLMRRGRKNLSET